MPTVQSKRSENPRAFVYSLKRAIQLRYSLLESPEYRVQYEQALGNQEHVAARCTISNINATVINSTHTIHQFGASPLRHGYVPLKKASISVMMALCGLTSVMLSVDWLELLSESDGVFLGLYVLSFASSLESDSVLKLSI